MVVECAAMKKIAAKRKKAVIPAVPKHQRESR